jgi:hypothetical protein
MPKRFPLPISLALNALDRIIPIEPTMRTLYFVGIIPHKIKPVMARPATTLKQARHDDAALDQG